MTQKKILVVDDDPHIREVITFALEKAEMSVTTASDGRQALQIYTDSPADLIVLDINMPEMDGLECCREIRKTSEVPILFLSSRDEEIDRILGLEIGGDDYVTKPFSPRELVARINVILKRTQAIQPQAQTDDKTLTHGKLVLDTEQHALWWDKIAVSLTATEFAMLAQMLKQPKRVFSRDAIMQGSYQYNVFVSDRTIDSHIRHIRSKFSEVGCHKIIETQHGVGYRLSACE
ncbi:response regulator transcription factor [Cocleimonas sp. KMM 6892]|uniref:response regulator transcription factor n=1 Tax=unclassified Cocleimonas TaxID=2639732 RepID=UPI002DBBA8D4|nr:MULTISPECIES: response regulator transcription factor [unclassified Cocleimonas]MEB8432033.1 response regulator transcription factor [Cocleimonas sp. KMM 6892]MEC4714881.1 response regulator transcription factor [Cocleimonas sp. KMM 6895]MEC4744305.1 response regulator transcription factor [Cocleimonas sp. KMM 6896]